MESIEESPKIEIAKPIPSAELVNPSDIQFSNEIIFDVHIKTAQANIDRIKADNIKAELHHKNENPLTPEEILIELAGYCEKTMSAPIDAVMDGSFADPAHKLVVEDGAVVLIRHASDSEHLIKSGLEATPEQMRNSSEFNGGAPESGSVHTSADIGNATYGYSRYPIYGEFRIPVKDFLELGKQGKIIFGNLGESEIIISGDIATKYLTKIVEKKKEI